ncbi:MAG: putative DNA-binding domain-containing protein [Chlamydiales bacterium]|nr:putative DNA-binding domain-containing protein [Chlamydiales bacterium]
MLEQLQTWFGSAIASEKLAVDASHYIAPSPTLEPNERLQIYHEQYWWRLLDVLQRTFPTLVRELGAEKFNKEVGIPYLLAHPPDHWALCRLGAHLPSWLTGKSATIAAIDWAAEIAFWEEEGPTIDFSKLTNEEIRTKKMTLQPYISLFALDADYFSFREGKKLEKRAGHFVVYRTPKKFPAWKKIPKEAYTLLCAFQLGCSIEESCSLITGGNEVAFWFKEWTQWQFFVQYS